MYKIYIFAACYLYDLIKLDHHKGENGWQKDVKGQQKGKSFERKDSTKDNKISLLRHNFLEIIYLTEEKMFIFYSLHLYLLPMKQQIMTYNVKLRVCFDGIQMQYQRAVFLLLPQTTIFCVRLFCRSYPFLPKDRKSIVNGWQTGQRSMSKG